MALWTRLGILEVEGQICLDFVHYVRMVQHEQENFQLLSQSTINFFLDPTSSFITDGRDEI